VLFRSRANGANKGHIYIQISGELFVISTIGLVLGLIIIFQIPLLHLTSFITAQVFVMSALVSIGIIYLLTYLCALYPSYLAAGIHPAEALHTE
jgi:putative ABC transport system permease protein